MNMEHGFYKSTTDANLVVSTTACSFLGVTVYASAAGTLTIVDSAAALLVPLKLSALEFVTIMLTLPIACTAGISATNSGSCQYTIFYGR